MTDSKTTSRNWYITVVCIPLFFIAVWFAIAAWSIDFEGPLPFEPIIRLVLSLVFAYSAYKLARVIKRGYLNVRLKDIARDFFAGIQ